MALNYHRLLSMPPIEVRGGYSRRDVILYALGIGIGSSNDATSPAALRYTYEADLQVMPTMAVVIGHPGFWLMDPEFGLDWKRVLHGEQSVELHQPLPLEGNVISRLRIDEIYDKGAAKGAVMFATREIFDAASGQKWATLRSASFLRGDGGFGGKTEGAPKPHGIPSDRPPDLTVDICTQLDQGLIYRLSGDYNPIHIDPVVARSAGFERPILHGLCSYGIVGRALIAQLCNDSTTAFRKLAVRFVGPVFPGDTLRIEIWREQLGVAGIRAKALERDVRVIDNGLFEYGEPNPIVTPTAIVGRQVK